MAHTPERAHLPRLQVFKLLNKFNKKPPRRRFFVNGSVQPFVIPYKCTMGYNHIVILRMSIVKVLILFLFALAFFVPFIAHAGFGVSPSLIQEDNLVPGATLERTFYLVQGKPVGDLRVEIFVESEKAQDWFTVLNAKDNIIEIPDGVQQFPVTVRIDVPKDAELGIYKAFVRANTLPASSGGQVTIALAAKAAFNLVVGDSVISEYEVQDINILNLETGDFPKAELLIRNTGNVPAGPSDATFELFNKFGDLRLAFVQENKITKEVGAFSEDTISLEFPLDITIGVGEYWGHVKVYDEDVLVKELKTVFEVTQGADNPIEDIAPEAVVAAVGEAKLFGEQYGIPPIALIAGGAVLGIFVLLILMAIIKKLFRRKPRRVSKRRNDPPQQRGPYDAQNNVVLRKRR